MNRNEILSHVRNVIYDVLERCSTDPIERSSISLDTDIRNDLGIDSMMAVDVAFGLSNFLNKDVPFEKWYVARAESGDFSVKSLVDFIESQM